MAAPPRKDPRHPEQAVLRNDAPRMFDRIASQYDFLNHFLSCNRDKAWRRRLADMLDKRPNQRALDIATGTADQLIALYRTGLISEGVGVDPAEQMLDVGRNKIANRGWQDRLSLQTGKAEELPFDDYSFDVVTMSFGLRNVMDVDVALGEIYRVLRRGGRTLILEFSLPASRMIRWPYLWYFRHILPRLGRVISGDRSAYRYLNVTVEEFPYGNRFCELMRQAGFRAVECTPLTFGVASIYCGEKQ